MLLVLAMKVRIHESMSQRSLDIGKDEETESPLNLQGRKIAWLTS